MAARRSRKVPRVVEVPEVPEGAEGAERSAWELLQKWRRFGLEYTSIDMARQVMGIGGQQQVASSS